MHLVSDFLKSSVLYFSEKMASNSTDAEMSRIDSSNVPGAMTASPMKTGITHGPDITSYSPNSYTLTSFYCGGSKAESAIMVLPCMRTSSEIQDLVRDRKSEMVYAVSGKLHGFKMVDQDLRIESHVIN